MVQCPICHKSVDESMLGNPGSTFPFCSERCKLRDLGKWLSGAYQIPVEANDDETDESPPEVWVDPDVKRKPNVGHRNIGHPEERSDEGS